MEKYTDMCVYVYVYSYTTLCG